MPPEVICSNSISARWEGWEPRQSGIPEFALQMFYGAFPVRTAIICLACLHWSQGRVARSPLNLGTESNDFKNTPKALYNLCLPKYEIENILTLLFLGENWSEWGRLICVNINETNSSSLGQECAWIANKIVISGIII